MRVIHLVKLRKFIICLVLCSVINVSNAQLREGDVCTLADSVKGTCTRKNECYSTDQDAIQGIRPVFCSHKGRVDIICCRYQTNSGQRSVQGGRNNLLNTFPEPDQAGVQQALENIYDLEQMRGSSNSRDFGRKKHSISAAEAHVNVNERRRSSSREGEKIDRINSREHEEAVRETKQGASRESDSLESSGLREKRVWGQSVNYENVPENGQKQIPLYNPNIQYHTTTRKYQEHNRKPVRQQSWEDTTQRPTKSPYSQLLTERPIKSPQYYQEHFPGRPTKVSQEQDYYYSRTTKAPVYQQETYHTQRPKPPKRRPVETNNPQSQTEKYNHNQSGSYYNKPTEYYQRQTEKYERLPENNYIRPIDNDNLRPNPANEESSILFPSYEPGYHKPNHNPQDFNLHTTRRPVERPDNTHHQQQNVDYHTTRRPDNTHHNQQNVDYHTTRRPDNNHHNQQNVDYHTTRRPDNNHHNQQNVDYHTTRRPDNAHHNQQNVDYHTTRRPDNTHYNQQNENQHTTRRPVVRPENTHHNQQNFDRQTTRRPVERKTISELKCKEYSEIVTETIAGLPLTADPKPVEIQIQKCNHNAQQLIVGGKNSTAGEFPHMAAVGFINKRTGEIKWGCGGSLISENYVLTAAHCTDIKYGNPGIVRLGEVHLKRDDDGAHPVDIMVKEMISHPEYRPPRRYNDIALLKLTRPVTFNIDIRPACLYTQTNFPVTKTVATGWGSPQYAAEPSPMLLKVVINIIDNNKCNSLYKAESKTPSLSRGIIDAQMCAGDLNGQKDTCQGDSGGPIEITTRSNQCLHHIIGVTSFGKRCGLPNAPGVYTRVSSYVPWIESIVWPAKENESKESSSWG